MSIDLKMESTKQEYVNAINKINEKYELPISIIEIILSSICNEVHTMKILQIQQEKEELAKQENKDEKRDGDK